MTRTPEKFQWEMISELLEGKYWGYYGGLVVLKLDIPRRNNQGLI